MDTVLDIVTSEAILNIVAVLAAALWAAMMRTQQAQRLKKEKFWRVVQCLEIGVKKTYDGYVKALKANNGGHLTDEQKLEACRRALRIAQEHATTEGIDVLSEVSNEYASVLIAILVQRFKAKNVRINS